MMPSTWWQQTLWWCLGLACLAGSSAEAQQWRPADAQPHPSDPHWQPQPDRSQLTVRVPQEEYLPAPQYVPQGQPYYQPQPAPHPANLQDWLNPPATLDDWLANPEASVHQGWSSPSAKVPPPAQPLPTLPQSTRRVSYQADPPPRFVHPASRMQDDLQTSKTLEERLEELESEFKELQQGKDDDFAKSFQEVEKYVDKLKEKDADKKKKSSVSVSGRIHLDTWIFSGDSPLVNYIERRSPFESPEDRMTFRRMRIGAKGDIPWNMEYKLELELAGGNDSQYRDVYLGWNELPYLHTLLIGNQKRPYGLDHLNSSRYNVFLERPFIIEAFNQDARRIGIASYGLSDDLRYNWRWGYYMGEIAQSDAGPIGDYWQGEFTGRFANTIWYDESSDGRGYAHWAISGSVADPAPDGDGSGLFGTGQHESTAEFRQRPEARSNRRWIDTDEITNVELYELLGLEAALNLGPLQIVGEYQNVWMQRQTGNQDLFFWGGYVYASYFLTGEHMPWSREKGTLGRPKPFQNFFMVRTCDDCIDGGWGAWQVAARYSYADLSNNDIRGGVGQSLTLGLNWYWNPNARVQMNYIWGEIRDSRFTNLAAQDGFDVGSDGDYHILGARWMIDY